MKIPVVVNFSICMLLFKYKKLKKKKSENQTCVWIILGSMAQLIPKVACKVLSEYLYVCFKGEMIHSTNQSLKGVHNPPKVKKPHHQSLQIQKNY